MKINMIVNGGRVSGDVEPTTTLLRFIRETLGLTGTKAGCEDGECGACTILLNGSPVRSCLVLAAEAEGSDIMTIEGLQHDDGTLHPIQQAFVDAGAIQCGFCTPGMLLAAHALLNSCTNPTDLEIRESMGGHLCRCGTYPAVELAVKIAATSLNVREKEEV